MNDFPAYHFMHIFQKKYILKYLDIFQQFDALLTSQSFNVCFNQIDMTTFPHKWES